MCTRRCLQFTNLWPKTLFCSVKICFKKNYFLNNRVTKIFFFFSGFSRHPGSPVVDPRSPVRPVSFLARSQSHNLVFISGFSRHPGSPVVVDPRSSVRPVSFLARSQSHSLHTSLLHTSFHLVFGLPLFLCPGNSFVITLLTTCSSSLLIT